jgi:primosomal protein N'
MPTYKAGGKYRLKFVLKCRLNAKIRAFLGDFLKGFAKRGGIVTLSVDLNPA